ncbi:hypothetical protein ACSBR1_009779 [Camellia fascicularis]
MDRSWMQLHNRRSPQYIDGVMEFIMFARDHMKPGTYKIWCLCYRCTNHIQKTIEEVEIHLYAYGVVTSYTRWVYHGEGFELNDHDDSQNENDEYLDNVTEKSDSPNTEVREVIHDLRSRTTTFGYVGESKKSLTMLLELLNEALSIGEMLPCSYNEAKQIIRDLGLDYKKIHVCKNDCVLFWKEYENEDECPTYKAPRYKVRKGKGKKIPHKVLRYFPLKPRLQRLFISRKTAIDMKWHKDKRVEEENVLRHSVDSEAWKDFDKKHESFAKDPRNARLGLASDGFNPFGNMRGRGRAGSTRNMEKKVWRFLCEKWSDKDYKVRCGKNKLNREKLKVLHTASSKAFRKVQYDEYKLEKRQDKAIEDGSSPLSDEQLSIEVFGQKSSYIQGLGHGLKPSTTLSRKRTRTQLERYNEAATGEAEEQRRINGELVERIQILESDCTEYNAKVDFLMQ